MSMNLKMPDITELKPHIIVFGTGGAGGNAVNNMITSGLEGVDFVVANTDAQALMQSKAERIVQMGVAVTEGLGAGSQPEVGRAAAEEVIDEIRDHLSGAHMVFITAGMGGGTGTGAAPVIARAARELGILTVGVVTKPFHFEGQRRMRLAESGITELQKNVDTLIVIPNQNLFRVANERTTFADAFAMADQVLYSGVACITDLMVKEGLINLDFADVRAIMREMGKAMMGTGEASGDKRAIQAAEAAIANPLLDEVSMRGARGLLISITGGSDLTLYEVDEAATRIREEIDEEANIILGATFDDSLEGVIRVSVVATGIDQMPDSQALSPAEQRLADKGHQVPPPRPAEADLHAPAQGQPQPHFRPAQGLAQPMHAEPAAPQSTPAGVTIAPFQPSPSFYNEPEAAPEPQPAPQEYSAEPFIPPMPERAVQGRMPRIEDFPTIAQQQYAAHREGEPQAEPRRKSGGGLLRRLANVGIGRREEEPYEAETGQAHAHDGLEPMFGEAVQEEYAHREPAPAQHYQPAPPAPQPAPQQAPAYPASEYAKRPQPSHAGGGLYRPRAGDLDPHGRQQPQPAQPAEDDQLEIPAFLRRQSS